MVNYSLEWRIVFIRQKGFFVVSYLKKMSGVRERHLVSAEGWATLISHLWQGLIADGWEKGTKKGAYVVVSCFSGSCWASGGSCQLNSSQWNFLPNNWTNLLRLTFGWLLLVPMPWCAHLFMVFHELDLSVLCLFVCFLIEQAHLCWLIHRGHIFHILIAFLRNLSCALMYNGQSLLQCSRCNLSSAEYGVKITSHKTQNH